MNYTEAIKKIGELAAELPEFSKQEFRKRLMTGHDLKLLNKKTVSGKPIVDNQIYEVKLTEPIPVHHKQEMLKIYRNQRALSGHDDAWQGVMNYIAEINRITKNSTNGKNNKKEKSQI